MVDTERNLAEKLRKAEEDSAAAKENAMTSLQELEKSHRKEINEQTDKAAKECEQGLEQRRDLEQQLALAQANLTQLQATLDEKARMHELMLLERNARESAQLDDARGTYQAQQSALIEELSQAQKYSQHALRQVQDECFATIDRIRQEAMRDSERRLKEGTAKVRMDLWQAQQTFNTWQRRLDKVARELADLGYSDPTGTRFDPPDIHPLEYVSNRILLRAFRGLLEEKQATASEEELQSLFASLRPANVTGQKRLLSNDDFRNAVLKSLMCKRRFDLSRFVDCLPRESDGRHITLSDFETSCREMLGLDRETVTYVFQLAESSSRIGRYEKPTMGCVLEEDIASFLDYPQIRKIFDWESTGDEDMVDPSVAMSATYGSAAMSVTPDTPSSSFPPTPSGPRPGVAETGSLSTSHTPPSRAAPPSAESRRATPPGSNQSNVQSESESTTRRTDKTSMEEKFAVAQERVAAAHAKAVAAQELLSKVKEGHGHDTNSNLEPRWV
jgi:hypothetical protein